MTQLRFPNQIGLGTWKMGESRTNRRSEIAAVQHALAIGYRLVDTAEMYGDGGAERVVGDALEAFGRARRSELFIVSKVLPSNASRAGTIRACEASIRRMGCEYLDLYLLHWQGRYPFADTHEGMAQLLKRGLVKHIGVSNLDTDELGQWLRDERASELPGRTQCNQIYYCLEARGAEFELLPWQKTQHIQTMAYSPLAGGDLVRHPALERIGRERGVTAAQIALAWCIREPDVVAIPKSVQPERIEENLRSATIRLSSVELAAIDCEFPAPRRKEPLAVV